ncbi:hypothetical protein LCGC14_2979620 [marine sediment metagenome]|uniref:Uncharacterized protein n=1 Tax=marine sediment metagenome TaxID=412755 RepID=A0A0F8X7W1_9ZZZZ
MTDYASKVLTMESFTSQETDGAGEIELTLQETPAADDSIMLYCSNTGYMITLSSRAAKVLTVLITKLIYDKTDTPLTGSLGNLPGGVTESATRISTDSGAGTGFGAVDGVQKLSVTHTHLISKTYQHDHTPTYTTTAMAAATTQAGLNIIVIYAKA